VKAIRTTARAIAIALLVGVGALVLSMHRPGLAQAEDILTQVRVDNSAEPLPNMKRGSYSWWERSIYLTGPEAVLDRIRCVKYTLHPTFSEPVQIVCDLASGPQEFSLTRRGCGTFLVQVELIMRDDSAQRTVALPGYMLRFESNQ
jgi:transcription initiation factor IIF auxiliary subunit